MGTARIPTIYTFEETREILKTSKSKLRKLLNSGELKGFKIGSYQWRVAAEDLTEYLDSLRKK